MGSSSEAEAEAQASARAADSIDLRRVLTQYLLHGPEFNEDDAKDFARNVEPFEIQYALGHAALIDSQPPVEMVYVLAPAYWCGTGGCTTLVISRASGARKVIADVTGTRPPIDVLPTTHRGWHDLRVRAVGGDSRRNGWDVYEFDGTEYEVARSEPLAARDLRGTVVISDSSRFVQLYP